MRPLYLASLVAVVASTAAADTPSAIVIHAARLLDVRRGVLVDDAVVVVEGERVVAAGKAASVKAPRGARVLELKGLTLLPGLVDAHVHLAWGKPEPGKPLPG